MDRRLVQLILLTLIWTFVVFEAASLGAALFSVYPSDPLFLRLALLFFLAFMTAVLTSLRSAWGWYIGVIYVFSSVSHSIWQIIYDDPAWRPSMLRAIAADMLFGTVVFIAARNNVRTRPTDSSLD